MKKVLFVLSTILLTMNVFSQENKNQISFSIGPSFASGEFADKSTSNENGGAAGTGVNLYLYYEHKFNENFGLGIKCFRNSNKVYTDATIDGLNSSTGYQWTASTSYWSAGGLLVGLTAHIPSSDKFIVNFRFLGGYTTLNSPEATFAVTTLSNTWVKMESESAASFGYNIGAGFSYFFNPKWSLLVNIDYIGGDFKFDDIVMTSSAGTSEHLYNAKQSLGVVNATVGIGYNF
jgi:hypothetical protein